MKLQIKNILNLTNKLRVYSMKPISEIISNTPDNNRIEPIIAGTKFKIATSAYSDRTYIDVICLKEINHQVIEQMNLEFEILENKRNIYGLYDIL